MNKFHVFIIVLFGIFLVPSNTHACGIVSKNHTNKIDAAKSKANDLGCSTQTKCCNKQGCLGKCGGSKCDCNTAHRAHSLILIT